MPSYKIMFNNLYVEKGRNVFTQPVITSYDVTLITSVT